MICAKPTESLTGVTIEGDFDDFYEIVESIYRMTGIEEDYDDSYWSVKNRLLGMCYDIRHAYMGDRDIKLVDNGVYDELEKWYSMKLPKQAVHYSVNVLFPEAVFVALSLSELYDSSRGYYGQVAKKQKDEDFPAQQYSDYVRDRAILNTLSAVILEAFAEVVWDDQLEKLIRLKERQFLNIFNNYATQYVDKCNIEYLKAAPKKKKGQAAVYRRRFIQHPDGYMNMRRELIYAAAQYRCSYHEIHDERLKYPEEIEW